MERKFTLSCCSTVDLPYSYMESRDIPVLFYTYVVDGQTYDDDMGRDPAALPRFYGFLKEGKLPQTSQINVAGYMDFFERLLQQGGDVLHIAFTSGQSCSVNNAYLAAAELKDKYPGQKLIVIDAIKFDAPKTKAFAAFMSAVNASAKSLVVTAAPDQNVALSGRNLPGVKTTMANMINTYDILKYDTLVVDKASLTVIEEVFA